MANCTPCPRRSCGPDGFKAWVGPEAAPDLLDGRPVVKSHHPPCTEHELHIVFPAPGTPWCSHRRAWCAQPPPHMLLSAKASYLPSPPPYRCPATWLTSKASFPNPSPLYFPHPAPPGFTHFPGSDLSSRTRCVFLGKWPVFSVPLLFSFTKENCFQLFSYKTQVTCSGNFHTDCSEHRALRKSL